MVMKENFKTNENVVGKLCDFRGHTVLVVRKLLITFKISDNLEMPQRYEVMFNDGTIDVVSANNLKLINK